MVIEVKNHELDQLIALLSKKKHSIITRTQCALQSLPNPTHQVSVDNIEDPLFVLLSPNQQYVQECGYTSRYHLYIDDNKMGAPDLDVKLSKFLDSCHLNDTSKQNEFSAVNVPVFHALSRYFADRVIKVEQGPISCVFVFDSQARNELPVLDEKLVLIKLGSIRPEEAEEVIRCTRKTRTMEFWKGYVTHSIANYPSVCMRDTKHGNRLACFVMAGSCVVQSNIFTYPAYRTKGLASVVAVAHTNQLEPIFGAAINTIAQENTASLNLVSKLNYKLQIDHRVVWFQTGEFARNASKL